MTFADALRLGRVSNLPTVWTNALAGLVLSGLPGFPPWHLFVLLSLLIVAVSFAYVGGMFLNDAFDAAIDAKQRPERPIPSGRVSRGEVLRVGLALLALSVAALGVAGLLGGTGLRAPAAAVALVLAIVIYDWWHKNNPLGPLLMGLCRVLVYVAAGFCVARELPAVLWIGAALLLAHLMGLTYIAKQETLGRIANLWPLLFLAAPIVLGFNLIFFAPAATPYLVALLAADVIAVLFLVRRKPGDIARTVITLIAAISLLDAMLIAGTGRAELAAVAAFGFALTLALQVFVRGT